MIVVERTGKARLTILCLAMVITSVLAIVACGGKSKSKEPPAAGTSAPLSAPAAARSTPALAANSPTPTIAQATPTEVPDESPMARLLIPKINVDANFVTLGIIASTNTMDSPKTKDDVAYYDFTPRSGYGGNTVLSGHVDWYTGQTGVFWDLKKLALGDEIDVVLQDGKKYRYKVTEANLYNNEDAPIDDIIGDTPVESVTLITCEGTFDKSAAEYNKRRVIRAERIYA